MTIPVPGKLPKQGPFTTLSNFSHGEEDRFMFNGQQFVSLSAQSPKVILSSARKTIGFDSEGSILYASYNNYTDVDGIYRFVNGTPTIDSRVYTGNPGSYDHVVIGYDSIVSTSTIKFWTLNYINPDFISVDCGNTTDHFFNISGISVSYEFDDSIRHHYSERIPSGMYIYTITLGNTYIAKYWRIKSFLIGVASARVTDDISTKDVNIISTTNWPSSGDVYFYSKPGLFSTVYTAKKSTSFTSSTYNSSTGYSYVEDLKYTVNSDTVPYGGYILVEETFFNQSTGNTTTECLGYAVLDYLSGLDLSTCSASSPLYVDRYARGRLPDGIEDGDTGPHGGVVSVKMVNLFDHSHAAKASYSSKTSSLLETLSCSQYSTTSEDLLAGTIIQLAQEMELEQVRIKEETVPLMRFWETGGDECVTKEIDISDVYDAVYDRGDGVYYAVIYKPTGGSDFGMSDDFSTGDSSSEFSSNRWSVLGGGLVRDNGIDCLVFKNTISGTIIYGSLSTNSYHQSTSDFEDSVDAKITTLSGSVGYYGLVSKDVDTDNHITGVYALGDWDPIGAAVVAGVKMYSLIDATEGEAVLRNFRFDPQNLPADELQHTFSYEDSTWKYSRVSYAGSPTVSDIDEEDVGNNTHISRDGFTLTLDKNSTISDGSYFSFYTKKDEKVGVSQRDVDLKLSYSSTANTIQAIVDDGSEHVVTGSVQDSVKYGSEIVGYTNNYTTVSSTGFITTGDYIVESPCLRVVSFDNDGKHVESIGVSDSNGVVISSFDVFKTYGLTYGDYYNKVSIATTGESLALNGALFIRVDDDIYKYDKTTLPLGPIEDGTNAVVLSSGVVQDSSIYNFSFDGYTNGGLSYVYYDLGRSGTFLKEIKDSTLQNTSYETELDVSSASIPFAWDVEDMDVLYVMSGSDVYAYNTDESSVAFTNMSVDDDILPANSTAQTTINACVINLFGDPLSGKRVYFSIDSGAGSISPASSCTTVSGIASTIFTAATVSGTTVISATASNDSC